MTLTCEGPFREQFVEVAVNFGEQFWTVAVIEKDLGRQTFSRKTKGI